MKAIEQAHTSTAIAESESEMSRTGALKEQIEQRESNLAELSGRIEKAKADRLVIIERRRKFLVSARVRKDKRAQSELDSADKMIELLDRQISDDEQAFGEVKRELDETRKKLEISGWYQRREVLRTKLLSRASGTLERRMIAAIAEITQLWAEILDDDCILADAVANFDRSLGREAGELRRMERLRSDLIACALRQIIEIRMSEDYARSLSATNLEDHMQRIIRRIVDTVDGMGWA